MEANKLLKSVNNLNEYIHISNDVVLNYNDVKIQFNMSTILALKKVRSFEIEYFNKCEENGAAIKIFELILRLPPSKTWNLLGRELISLLQYWLDAMRKHLIFHNNHWWTFLQILLKFIKEIRVKDNKISNILLEETAECLLDLASHRKPDVIQRHEILCLFNLCGADSSREIRFALRKQLDSYFTKLSAYLTSCGDVAMQYSILEALLRWLLPRQDRAVRVEAASKWFSEQLTKAAVEIFLDRQWLDFFQDARDLLNAHNKTGDLIISVVCKRLSVGSNVVIGNGGSRIHWLDMNLTTGRLSITLEPKDLENLSGELTNCCGTLVLTEALSIEVKFCREGSEVTISVVNSRPPLIVPSLIAVTVKDHQVKMTISPNGDMAKVDGALRRIFGAKYQVLCDVANNVVASKLDDCLRTGDDIAEEEKRFSGNTESKRRRHVGYIVNSKRSGALASPSTASTSSLAQLHDKLAALPRFNYEKESVSVCVRPQLSNVTELSDEDRQSLTSGSTIKLRPYGVCQKSAFSKAQIEAKCKQNYSKCLSPAIVDENSVSCLLVATIGSADESVINETLERLPQSKDNTDNIVDLLVLEAFQSKINKEVESSNIENKEIHNNSDGKDANDTKYTKGRACTVISNSSLTEESNTEFVEGTQFTNINIEKRKKGKGLPLNRNASQAFDERAVEEFFSQHFAENRNGDLVISPTLAKKINETSSETSEEFDADELNFESRERVQKEKNKFIEQTVPNIDEIQLIQQKEVNFDSGERVVPDLEVIECVNFILDRICLEYTLCQEGDSKIDEKKDVGEENRLEIGGNSPKELNIKAKTAKVSNKKTSKGVKLKFSSNKNTRSTRQKNKLNLAQPCEDLYTIDEVKECSASIKNIRSTRNKNKLEEKKQSKGIHEIEVQDSTIPNKRHVKNTEKTMKETDEIQDRRTPNITDNKQDNTVITPIARRKRKLYSPKDEKCAEKDINNEVIAIDDLKSLNSEEITSDTAPEFKSHEIKKQFTYYKQIEQDRKNYRKKLRNRKLKSIEMEMSPKSKRLNEAFDDLKKGVEDNEQILLTDKSYLNDIAIYNFTSDSEDEDFKKKTPKRKTNTIKVEEKQTKRKVQPKRKKANQSKTGIKIEKVSHDLVDERMREPAVGLLNTSIEPQKSSDSKYPTELPILTIDHEMEPIEETNIPKETIKNRKIVKKPNKAEKNLSLIAKSKTPVLNETTDRTESPLPGLLVEANVPHDSMLNETVTAKMMEKFQEIYERKSVYESERESTRNLIDTFNSSKNMMNITEASDYISKDHVKRNDIPTSKPSSTKEQSSPFRKPKRKRKNSSDSSKNITKYNKSLIDLKEKDTAHTFKSKTKSLSRKGTSNSIHSIEGRKTAQTNKTSKVLNERNNTEPKIDKATSKSNSASSHKRELDFEVINISGVYSEKSFDTVGHSPITAHGDLNLCENDLPPSKESWTRNLEPRNLEVEDFDQSIKDFFTELNKEIAEGTYGVRDTKSSTSDGEFNEPNEERSNNVITTKQSKSIIRLSDISNIEDGSNKSSVAQLKSPLVSVTRMSSDEIKRWLLPRSNSEGGKTPTKEPDRRKNTKIITDKKKDSSKPKGAIKKVGKSKESIIGKKEKIGRFTSSISPIKLFDEPNILSRRDSSSSTSTEREISERNFKNKMSSPVASCNTKVDNYCEVKSSCDSNARLKSFVSDIKITSTQTSKNAGQMVETFGSQRMESGPSTSSVNDWFSRIAPRMSQEEAMRVDFKDNVSSIMEKLDTTLVEIHHDTSKRLAGMFAEAQAKLSQAKRERKLLYQKTASDLLSGVLRLVDEHFTELDKRSQEMDEKFMLELKEKSRSLLREDCTKKKAMVRLLREDVQAVLESNSEGKKPKMK